MAVQIKLTVHSQSMRVKLTTAALVLHSYVLLALAGVLVEFTLVAVVLSIAAAHRLLSFARAPEGAHALRRQAVGRLDAGASIAAGHLRAGVLQCCRNQRTRDRRLVGEKVSIREEQPFVQLNRST